MNKSFEWICNRCGAKFGKEGHQCKIPKKKVEKAIKKDPARSKKLSKTKK